MMSETKPKALTFQSAFSAHEDDFGIPSSPQSSGTRWILSVHRDPSPTRMKTTTTEPDPFTQGNGLSVPQVSPNLGRRASCPNFTIPEFSVAPTEQSRLTAKRPSIISQAILDQFKVTSGIHNLSGASSVIEEGREYNSSDSAAANLSEKPAVPSVVVPAVQPPNQKPGFLASRMTSIFKADNPPSLGPAASAGSSVDGVAPATNKKKSYLMKRAAAITNTDVNAMAPSSL